MRVLLFLLIGFLVNYSLFAHTRLQFEWAQILRGAIITRPVLEGENVYVISQDRYLYIFSLSGKEKQRWGGGIRLYPYLMKGNRSGEVFVVSMDNVIHKLVGGVEKWSQRVPFLCGEPSLSEEGYLIVPVEGGGVRVLYPYENIEVLHLKGKGKLVLPVISDPWARFYLASENKIRSMDSWGNQNWELDLDACPLTWLFSKKGELVVGLANREVIRVGMAGQIIQRKRQDFPIVRLLEREDGLLLLINEMGRVSLCDATLNCKKTRHFGLFIKEALVLNKGDLLLLSDKYWIVVNSLLEVCQVFKGAKDPIAANFNCGYVAVVDKNWTLSLFSFKGLPLNQVNYWACERGDTYLQGRNREAIMEVNEKDPAFSSILLLRDSYSAKKVQALIEQIETQVEEGSFPKGLVIEKINLLMQLIMKEVAKKASFYGFDERLDIYKLLGRMPAPFVQSLLVRYGYWEKDLRATMTIFQALSNMQADPRGIMLDYFFYALEKFQANKTLISLALDIIEEFLAKSVYLNTKKVNNMFNYVLRHSISEDFRVRIKEIKQKYNLS